MNRKLMRFINLRCMGFNGEFNFHSQALYERALSMKSIKLSLEAIDKWYMLGENEQICLENVLNLFECITENGTETDIRTAEIRINEVVIPKIRDAKAARDSIKRRLSRFKSRITTKINKKLDTIKDTGLNTKIVSVNNNALVSMVECCNRMISCDNIINNHAKLSKVYNIDKFVYSNSEKYLKENFYEFVAEFASMIDTYDIPFTHKYNIALENISYALSKYGITYNSDTLVEAVTDYFLMSDSYLLESQVDNIIDKNKKCKDPQIKTIIVALTYAKKDKYSMSSLDKLFITLNKVMLTTGVTMAVAGIVLSIIAALPFLVISTNNITKIYDKNIKKVEDHLKTCDSPEHQKILKLYLEKLKSERPDSKKVSDKLDTMKKRIKESSVLEDSNINIIDNYIALSNKKSYDDFFNTDDNVVIWDKYESIVIEKVNDMGKNKVKELLNQFKIQNIKTPEAFKIVINKIFTKDADDIISETPNILTWIFTFFVVLSAASISIILSLIAAMTTFFLHMHLQRKQCEKIITVYKNNKTKAENKLSKTTNEESKKRIEAYIKKLDDDIKKLEDYYDDIKSEDEKYKDLENDDFDIDFDEFKFDEATLTNDKNLFKEVLEAFNIDWDNNQIESILINVIPKMHLDDIDTVTEFAIAYPDFINNEFLQEQLTEYYSEVRKQPGVSKYITMDCLRANIVNLESSNHKGYNGDWLFDLKSKSKIIKESLCEYNYKVLNEMNFTNTIKLAIEGLKKATVNLSDKEKMMSATIDSSLDMMKDKVEKALTQENREAVIKGNILPPASKIIKLAITSGLAWMIHPALAVITILGTFAVNTKIRAKERQLIYEELDVELQMVDKYIRVAEEKNDLKNLRELLKIKRKLQAQESRLKYKMNIDYNQKTKDSTEDRD